MRKFILKFLGLVVVALKAVVIFGSALVAVALAGFTAISIVFLFNYFPGIMDTNASSSTLTSVSPSGFSVSVFAHDLKSPRFMAADSFGNIIISSGGEIMVIVDNNHDAIADGIKKILGGMDDVAGVSLKVDAAGTNYLFIAKSKKVSVYEYDPVNLKIVDKLEAEDVDGDLTKEALDDLARQGQATIPEGGWPGDYAGDVLVIDRQSYNNNFSKEYKIIRHNFDGQGDYLGSTEFFTGSPADLLAYPASKSFITDLYVSDDRAGVIYRIIYGGGQARRFLEVHD